MLVESALSFLFCLSKPIRSQCTFSLIQRCCANQVTGFYMKCNTVLERVLGREMGYFVMQPTLL